MIIKQIISIAEHPVEDMSGTADDPCLLVTITNIELAIQLFRHSILTMRKRDKENSKFSAGIILFSLIEQGMQDQRVYNCFLNNLLLL